MTNAAIHEAATRHAEATTEWHAALLTRQQAKAAYTKADNNAEIAGKKMRDAAANYERLMGVTNEGE